MNRVMVATALITGMASLGTQAARADVITQHFDFATISGSNSETGPTLNGFNSALGTLTSVVISDSVTATWSGGGSSDFNDASYFVFVGSPILELVAAATGNTSGSDSGSLTLTDSADLARFAGGTQATSVAANNSPLATASLSSTFGTGTLTYNYTPATSVLEPGSLALLTTGLLGLALLRHRRRS